MVRAAVLIGDEFDHITEVPSYTAPNKFFLQFLRKKMCREEDLYELSLHQMVAAAGGHSYPSCPLPEHGVTDEQS